MPQRARAENIRYVVLTAESPAVFDVQSAPSNGRAARFDPTATPHIILLTADLDGAFARLQASGAEALRLM